jgi:hypothetical protein
MNVKTEIEKHPYVLNLARALNYHNPGSTLFDLRDELRISLDVVDDLIARYGESTLLRDKERTPIEPV